MAETLNTIRAILGTALAVDRRATISSFLIGVLAWVGNAAQALTVAFFVQAFIVHDATLAWLAVVANAIAFGANNYLFSLANAIGITLQEKTTHALDARLQELVAGIDGIELLERPDYLDRLSTLRAQTYWFGNVSAILGLPQVLLNVVATAILLYAIDPPLALVPLAGLPAFYLNGQGETILRRAEDSAAPARRMRRRLLELGTDADAAAEARLFGTRDELLDRFLSADNSYRRTLDAAEVKGTLLSIVGWLIFGVAFAASFVVVATGIRDGQLPIAALFATIYLVRLASFQASVSLNAVASIRRTVTATRNMLWLDDRAREAAPATAPAAPLPATGSLRFEAVTFRYPGAAADALRAVTLEIAPGSTLAIVGDNGAGKTTLVKLLARFYEPTAGIVTVGGVDIGSIDVGLWRAALTACLQDFSRFEFVVRETVGVGHLPAIADETVVRPRSTRPAPPTSQPVFVRHRDPARDGLGGRRGPFDGPVAETRAGSRDDADPPASPAARRAHGRPRRDRRGAPVRAVRGCVGIRQVERRHHDHRQPPDVDRPDGRPDCSDRARRGTAGRRSRSPCRGRGPLPRAVPDPGGVVRDLRRRTHERSRRCLSEASETPRGGPPRAAGAVPTPRSGSRPDAGDRR